MVSFKKISLLALTVALFGCASANDADDDYFAGEYGYTDSASAQNGNAKKTKLEKVKSTEAKKEADVVAKDVVDTKIASSEPERKSAVTADVDRQAEIYNMIKTALEESRVRFSALRENARSRTADYFATVAEINARLQIGTTPGNPDLLDAQEKAVQSLTDIGAIIKEMKSLGADVNKQASLIAGLQNSITQVFSKTGALESDHENLKRIEDDTFTLQVVQRRLADEINSLADRQSTAFKIESDNFGNIAAAIRNGKPFGGLTRPERMQDAAKSIAPAAQEELEDNMIPTITLTQKRALMIIQLHSAYSDKLYEAAQATYEKRPNAKFEIVAVYPAKSGSVSQAVNKAKQVQDTLIEIGWPSDRISVVKAKDAKVKEGEVRIFVK
ncbi:MAG: hypothetical protein MJ247_04975 [Alphaproteobacteria bacterium]|nr:hypothetical protein [Alphaproteobacteria bacterium]